MEPPRQTVSATTYDCSTYLHLLGGAQRPSLGKAPPPRPKHKGNGSAGLGGGLAAPHEPPPAGFWGVSAPPSPRETFHPCCSSQYHR